MRTLITAILISAAALAQSPFRFDEVSPASLQLTENGEPVFVYNHGVMWKEGVPEDRYRCCYLHPVWAPDGTILTDDFPKDHYHHRGIFIAWPITMVDGQQYDLWALGAIRERFERFITRRAASDAATLGLETGWYVGEKQVVREQLEIVARPQKSGRRELEFRIRLEATGGPVGLRGDPTDAKGYGGFNVRFAARQDTVITTDKGREAGDSNMVPHPWAQLEALFGGRRAGLRIDIDPSNPGYPNGWCLRHYGFLGVNFPGNETYTLQPGSPLTLKYRVTVFSGDAYSSPSRQRKTSR